MVSHQVSTPARPVLGTLQKDAKNPRVLVGLNSSRLDSPAIMRNKENLGKRDLPAAKPRVVEKVRCVVL